MKKSHFMKVKFRDRSEDFFFEVQMHYADRLQELLRGSKLINDPVQFFGFRTVSGSSIVMNMAEVQFVRFFWDAAPLPSDGTNSEEPIKIYLRHLIEPLEELSDFPDQVCDAFRNLEHGPDVVPFPDFDIENGETLQFNAREVVLFKAPSSLIDAGRQQIDEEAGMN